jgi:SAM-dependent methyltransferase
MVTAVAHPTDATLDAYQRAVAEYCAASPGAVEPPVAHLLDAVIQRVPPHGAVLEIGTGPGMEAQYLERRGLLVERTDATPAFVGRLRAQGHDARLLDVRDGDLGGPYDAVLAHAVFLHLERPHLDDALASCLRAARPGGVLACTLKEGDGEAWSDAKLGRPRWFVYWREPELRDVLSRSGWRVLGIDHVQGRVEPWLHVLCERASP